MKRTAAQPRRVARSRRDDRYQAGHATPSKRASAGWVQSIQDDTVTVVISGEAITGVIPLDELPTVGAIVEVEARGDLLVIPTWFEGPPPAPTEATLDIPATVVAYGIHSSLTPAGNVACISTDDGDTSYLRQAVASSGGSTGYNDNINFPPTEIPGTLLTTSLVTITKGTDSVSTGIEFAQGAKMLLHEGSVTPYWLNILARGAATWTEIVTPLIWLGEEWVTQAMVEAGTVDYNPGSALLNDNITGAGSFDSRWTYIALRVTYEPSP